MLLNKEGPVPLLFIFPATALTIPRIETSCRFIAAAVIARITKDLEAAFKAEFPDLSVEFV